MIQGASFVSNSTQSNQTERPNKPCKACQGDHFILKCQAFRDMTVSERLSLVEEKRLCMNCLKPGHKNIECWADRKCPINACGEKHNAYLHVDKETDTSGNIPTAVCEATAVGPERAIALPIVRVKVTAGDKSINTYALLDNASTNTFCTTNLVQRLDLVGKEGEMRLSTLERKGSLVKTSVVSMAVSDINNLSTTTLERVYTRAEIPILKENIPELEDICKWPHLSKIPVIDHTVKSVDLLIGQDNPELLVPQEIRSGGKGEPYATKTAL